MHFTPFLSYNGLCYAHFLKKRTQVQAGDQSTNRLLTGTEGMWGNSWFCCLLKPSGQSAVTPVHLQPECNETDETALKLFYLRSKHSNSGTLPANLTAQFRTEPARNTLSLQSDKKKCHELLLEGSQTLEATLRNCFNNRKVFDLITKSLFYNLSAHR